MWTFFAAALLTNAFDDAEAVGALGAVSIVQQPERRKGKVAVWTAQKMNSSWHLTCANTYGELVSWKWFGIRIIRESFHCSASCNPDWPEVAVFLVCLLWAHGFPSDVLHGAGCGRLLGQHADVSAVDVVSPIRADHVSSETWMPTVRGNRNVHPPPSSHFSSWSLHSVSVSAAGLAIAWQRGWRKMALWRRLRAAYPKRKYPSTSQQLSLSSDYAGLRPQMGFGIDTTLSCGFITCDYFLTEHAQRAR